MKIFIGRAHRGERDAPFHDGDVFGSVFVALQLLLFSFCSLSTASTESKVCLQVMLIHSKWCVMHIQHDIDRLVACLRTTYLAGLVVESSSCVGLDVGMYGLGC